MYAKELWTLDSVNDQILITLCILNVATQWNCLRIVKAVGQSHKMCFCAHFSVPFFYGGIDFESKFAVWRTGTNGCDVQTSKKNYICLTSFNFSNSINNRILSENESASAKPKLWIGASFTLNNIKLSRIKMVANNFDLNLLQTLVELKQQTRVSRQHSKEDRVFPSFFRLLANDSFFVMVRTCLRRRSSFQQKPCS